MKKLTFLSVCVFILSLSVFAQTKTNFAGTWELDKTNSKLDERMAKSIEGQTLIVTQTEKEFTVDVKTKRLPPPDMNGQMPPKDDAAMPPNGGQPPTGGAGGRGQGRGMGGGRGGMMGGMQDGATTYSLDGKETTKQQDSPMGQMPVTLKAKFEKDGSLKLSQISTFSTPMGEVTISRKETYTLSADGNTLTVKRETESPRGNTSSESIYKKEAVTPKM